MLTVTYAIQLVTLYTRLMDQPGRDPKWVLMKGPRAHLVERRIRGISTVLRDFSRHLSMSIAARSCCAPPLSLGEIMTSQLPAEPGGGAGSAARADRATAGDASTPDFAPRRSPCRAAAGFLWAMQKRYGGEAFFTV